MSEESTRIEFPKSYGEKMKKPRTFWACDPASIEIPREISQILIGCLRSDDLYFDEKLKGYLTPAEFTNLRESYIEKIQNIKQISGQSPRNLAVYQIISDYYPDFKWKILSIKKRKTGVQFTQVLTNNNSTKSGHFISLAMFLLRRVSLIEAENFTNKLTFYATSSEHSKMELLNFLTDIDASKINESQFNLIHNWFLRSKKNQEATIFTGICPDYSNTRIAKNLYRFTFEGLGQSVGVSALRLVEKVHKIHTFFKDRNIQVRHVAAIGDFEAFSDSVLQRVGETEESFIKKLHLSQLALAELIGVDYEMQYPLITELCDGKSNWNNRFDSVFEMLQGSNFGETEVGERELRSIEKSRRPLLQRWFPGITDSKLQEVVTWQAAEYATLSSVVHDRFADPLIIGVDHFKMLPFYNFHRKIPILYLKSNYMENDK